MSKNSIRPSSLEGIKRLAKSIKAEQDIQHFHALDVASQCAGYQNFRHADHVLRLSTRLEARPQIGAAAVAARSAIISRQSKRVLVPGTYVRSRRRGLVGLVYLHDELDKTVRFYSHQGLAFYARCEIVTPMDQAEAVGFRPMRLYLPYGKWSRRDGIEILFNRDYCPLWVKHSDGKVTSIDPETFVPHDEEVWFFKDGEQPWYNMATLGRCLAILREWGVDQSSPQLIRRFRESIFDGTIEQLTRTDYSKKFVP